MVQITPLQDFGAEIRGGNSLWGGLILQTKPGAFLHSANCADNTPQRQFLMGSVCSCMRSVETCIPSTLLVTMET